MVCKASMFDWGWGGVNLPWVYVHCAIYISASRSAKFGVVVCKASMLNWLGSQSVIDPCYTITPLPCQLTIDPYYTITPPLSIDHRSMLHCYTPSVCPRYLCIRLCVKCMWCSGLPWFYGWLEEGEGVSLSWKLFGVMVFQRSMLNWRRGPSAKSM